MTDLIKKHYLTLIDETLNSLRGKPSKLTPTPIELVPQPAPIKKPVTPTPTVEKKVEKPVETRIEPRVEALPKAKPTPPPVPAEKPKLTPKAKPIALSQSTKEVAPQNMSPFLSFMQRSFPHTRLHTQPLQDKRAQAVRLAYQDRQNLSSVPLLYDASLLPFRPLLENIAKAISLVFTPSRLLDITSMHSSDSWQTLLEAENVTLTLVPDSILASYPKLASLVDEAGAHALLGPHPLLHLPDLSLYQKDPLLKRSLWETLCQKLHTN